MHFYLLRVDDCVAHVPIVFNGAQETVVNTKVVVNAKYPSLILTFFYILLSPWYFLRLVVVITALGLPFHSLPLQFVWWSLEKKNQGGKEAKEAKRERGHWTEHDWELYYRLRQSSTNGWIKRIGKEESEELFILLLLLLFLPLRVNSHLSRNV